ncbi:hypothetical protein EOM09_07435 [bacterium]|nr:hypothetical protein [bacterium]
MRLTKENKQDIEKYILNSIDSENYNIILENEKQKLEFVYNTFINEFGFRIKQIGLYSAFSEYLQGLPSCINIDFYNYKILELAQSWGQEVETEKQQDKVINQWFDFITNQFFKLCKKYKIELKEV